MVSGTDRFAFLLFLHQISLTMAIRMQSGRSDRKDKYTKITELVDTTIAFPRAHML